MAQGKSFVNYDIGDFAVVDLLDLDTHPTFANKYPQHMPPKMTAGRMRRREGNWKPIHMQFPNIRHQPQFIEYL
jgi:hypothetical protein